MTRSLKHALPFFVIALCAIPLSSAYFEGCDYTYNVDPGYFYLESPYYPNKFPAGTSCRYKFVAPTDYYIQINCSVAIPQQNGACPQAALYLALDGDTQLRGSQMLCGQGSTSQLSEFNSVALAYISSGAQGTFKCQFKAIPQPCDCGLSANTKIVNGQQTNINEFPSMAYLSEDGSGYKSFCGATIIAHRYALTAAHCIDSIYDFSKVYLNVGDHDLSSSTESPYAARYRVANYLIHPNYQQNPDVNDLAILQTDIDIQWSRGVGAICLPPKNLAYNSFEGEYVNVIGWGTKFFSGPTSNTLQKVKLQVLSNGKCQQAYRETQIFSSHLCTYDNTYNRRDSCQFDSGGPVIKSARRQILLGVISFGDACGTAPNATGVNTRVTSYLDWIHQNTAYSTCNVLS